MIRRPPRSTQSRSSAASDVYKRQRSNASSTRKSSISPSSTTSNTSSACAHAPTSSAPAADTSPPNRARRAGRSVGDVSVHPQPSRDNQPRRPALSPAGSRVAQQCPRSAGEYLARFVNQRGHNLGRGLDLDYERSRLPCPDRSFVDLGLRSEREVLVAVLGGPRTERVLAAVPTVRELVGDCTTRDAVRPRHPGRDIEHVGENSVI